MNRKIKKGELNYDQTGRAFPDNPHDKENWECIWENDGKYYQIVGLPNHGEWEEIKTKMNKEQAKDELIEVLTNQMVDLSMMSKIELGYDVIEEIRRLKGIINQTETKFKVGDKAHKPKGYKFPCTIVGVFETIAGEVRVIGEMDEYGLLHIFNENQLEHYGKDEPDLLNEAYMDYYWIMGDKIKLTQNEFINKCKTDLEFSEKWGLTIEERELSDKERVAIFMENKRTNKFEDNNCDIPTKLITITYNDKKIESYE
jgi:hypothetical protein